MSRLPRRVAGVVTTYSKTTIVVMLLVTAVMAAGVPMVEQASDPGQFETESEAAEAQTYINENFATPASENQTSVQLIQRANGGNALSQQALIASLELQLAILGDESISATLVDGQPIFGVANAIGTAAIEQRSDLTEPTLENQLIAVRELDEDTLESLIASVLDADGNRQALGLMPTGYEPGSTTADAHLTIIRQQTSGGAVDGPEGFSQRITETQLALRDLANQQDTSFAVFGPGIIFDEIDRSLGDSIAIVGPLALVFVVVALTVAYRDLIDILLGVVGIVSVLLWTFGFMGWTGVNFNQILISVPVLLIGLSIDYAIHVFMRYREQRGDDQTSGSIRRSMTVALGGVGVALVWVTATAAIGFLANLTSPIGPLRDFGIVSAVGVVAALLIYGSLIPALKVEIDGLLEGLGLDRHKRAFGTGGGVFGRVLSVGATAARRAPVVVIVLTLVVTAGGLAGATQVDTSFSQEDFLADSPPSWTQSLPGSLAPGEYQAKDDLAFVQANFQQEGNEGELLIRPGSGELITDQTLLRLERATAEINELETAFVPPGGDAEVTTPLSVMQATAAGAPDSQFAQSFAAAAGTETSDPAELQTLVPEENVAGLFGQLLAANPQAAEMVYREDDSYGALRIQIGLQADADAATVAAELREVAATIETQTGGDWRVVATGDQVVNNVVEQDLLDTVIQGLAITLVLVFAFLAGAYRLTGSPASLGIVTLLPVVFAVTWILGSMWLLDIPFNSLTGTITSLTIGLGIAYSIHISSRYELELRRQGDVWKAMQTTVTGTGGALLGSAATTVGGFGTLAFAIFPVLQQFGIITGLTIIYAFLASVFVLPSLLVAWTRYLGPSAYFPPHDTDPGTDSDTDADGSTDPTAGGR